PERAKTFKATLRIGVTDDLYEQKKCHSKVRYALSVFSIAGSIHRLTPDRIVQSGTIETGNATRIISREGWLVAPVERFGISGEATDAQSCLPPSHIGQRSKSAIWSTSRFLAGSKVALADDTRRIRKRTLVSPLAQGQKGT